MNKIETGMRVRYIGKRFYGQVGYVHDINEYIDYYRELKSDEALVDFGGEDSMGEDTYIVKKNKLEEINNETK